MHYLSTYYREGDSAISLILQQATRQKGKVPILLAGLFAQQVRNGIIPEESAGDPQVWLAEYLTEWFYERVLPCCERKGPTACVDMVQILFAEKIRKYEQENPHFRGDALAVLFAMGEECFYVWRGNVDIQLLNLSFNRLHVRNLTRSSRELLCERAFWEPGTGLVLGMRDFFEHLPQEALKSCLGVSGLEHEKQVQRRLAEAAQEAARRGAQETAALFVAMRREAGRR